MPGSIRKFAVDFDGDGKIDLSNSPVDAIGSIANFLVQHGWKSGEPIVFPATVGAVGNGTGSGGGDGGAGTGSGANDGGASVDNGAGGNVSWEAFIGQGLEARFKLDELKAAGVTPGIEPPAGMLLGLVDLQNGFEPTEYWLGAANFFAITKYNRSFFYAMSVIDLGRAVKARTMRSQ
jgi:membrane-bound lytic murein transglycosylase B